MANKEKQAENKEKIGIGAWLALMQPQREE